jgi:hypothetical protein
MRILSVTEKSRQRVNVRNVEETTAKQSSKRVVSLSPESLRLEQVADAEIGVILNWFMTSPEKPTWENVQKQSLGVQHLYAQWQSLQLKDGILYRCFQRPDGTVQYWQVLVPKSLRLEYLKQAHDSLTSGHLSAKKTLSKLMEIAYWQGYQTCVEMYCRRCEVCAKHRKWPTERHGEMKNLPATGVFQKVSIDLCGPHLRSKQGYSYLLTVMDCFTKYLIAVPLRDKSALSVAKAIVERVYMVYGSCEIQTTDRGSEFCNEIMQNITKLLDIQVIRTTAY